MNSIKIAQTAYPVLDIIKNRWSARSFSDKPIYENEMNTILEAGSWAFSSMNEQPWRFIVALKNTPLFDQLFSVLGGGNQPWCKNAAALVLTIGKKTYTSNGSINTVMLHDVGAANMLMTLQGNSMGIYSHVMGGYDAKKSVEIFNLDSDFEPVAMMVFGFLDEAEKLDEPYKTRELTGRTRKPLDELILPNGGQFGKQ